MRGEGCPVFVLCPLVLVMCFAAAFIIGYDNSTPYISRRHLRGQAKAKLGHKSRPVSHIGGEEARRSSKIEDALRGNSEELQASPAEQQQQQQQQQHSDEFERVLPLDVPNVAGEETEMGDLEAVDRSASFWRVSESDSESPHGDEVADEASEEATEDVVEEVAEEDDASDSGLNLPFALRWPDTHPLIADLHGRRLTFSHDRTGAVDVESRPALAQASALGLGGDDVVASDLEVDMEWPSDLWSEIFASVEDEAFGPDLPFSLQWPETNPLVADLKG